MNWRQIAVGGISYQYVIGKQNVVIQNSVTKKKVIVGLDKITGMDWNTIERAKHKKYFSVTPKEIANHILMKGL
jgi:hypothetical protein